ncbi:MAG: DNA internalization-related competence protein ComEC/Rec2 [Muribaculaceae bacterium]|nr:DNA internalization-related competence protein ComEC/Rec2 [Muribaculaceae bacterium]
MRRPVCIMGLVVVIVLFFYLYRNPPTDVFPAELEGSTAVLTGRVGKKEYRMWGGKETLVIYLEDPEFTSLTSFPGLEEIEGVLCYGEEGKEPHLGSYIRIRGKLRGFAQATNPGEFDALSYYRTLNLQARLLNGVILEESIQYDSFRETLWNIRQYLAGLLDSCYEEEDASVLKAMLLGEKEGLDEETKELYRLNGVIHILSISGLHISIIGMGFYKLLHKIRCPNPVNILLSIAFMYCYGVMTGMSVSAVRAILMFSLNVGAKLFGRTYDMLTATAAAGMTILLTQPYYLYHSGFLFSFGAVLAIGLLAPVLEEMLPGEAEPELRKLKSEPDGIKPDKTKQYRIKLNISKWKQTIAVNLAVSLMTFPVYLYFYYEYPLYSLLLNFLIIPGAGLILAGGLLSLGAALICLPLAKLIALLPHFLLLFYKTCCRMVLYLPASRSILGKPENIQVVIFILLLGIAFFYGAQKRRLRFLQGILLALLCITLRFQGGLEITVLDVGQGDGIYLADGLGGRYLIDGGSSDKSDVGTYQILPFLKEEGVDRLDAVFVTHMDSDHYNGIHTLLEQTEENGISITTLVLPDLGESGRNETYQELEMLAKQQKIQISYLHKGDTMRHGKLRLTCLHPEKGAQGDTNEESIVLYLEYEAFTALFTGDLEGTGEESVRKELETLLSGDQCLTLLKVAHHGSEYSTSEAFLETASPGIALISAGRNNRYGHPHPALLQRLEQVGSRIYRTQEGGAITVTYRNGRVGVETFLRVW